MNDQASSLRKLKQLVDDQSAKEIVQPPSLEFFLSKVIRPTPFAAVALIINDNIEASIPEITSWLPALINNSPASCLWDQAKIIKESMIPKTQIKLQYPTPVRIETGLANLNLLPHIPGVEHLYKSPDPEKLQVLDHLLRSLKKFSEVWVTIKASELPGHQSILHATDAVCIMVPKHPDAIIKSYETVKNIHLSGYFSPMGLLDFASDKGFEHENSSRKIKIVAKQFLALDLVSSGMVLSNCTYIPPENEAGLNGRIAAIEESSRDFLYCLSESLIYPIPGINS